MLTIVFLIASLLIPLAGWFYFPVLTRELLRDLRIERILHYVALAGMGTSLYLREPGRWREYLSSGAWTSFPLLVITLIYAAVFAIVTNNIEDLTADRISNPDRPLVRNVVSPGHYLLAGWICLVWSLLVSFTVQVAMGWGILAISAGYYVYSCRPMRLKRFPFLAKLIIGANSLAIALCGFTLAGGKMGDFPGVWAIFILIPLSLAANFVDLKDAEGDSITGIHTLPVLWGLRGATWFIAGSTVVTYAMAAYLLGMVWVFPLVALLAALHIIFLFRKPFDEKPVFWVYVTGLFGLDVFLYFSVNPC